MHWNPRKFIEAEMRRIDEAAARTRRYVEDEHTRAVLRALAARKLELARMLNEPGTRR